MIRLNVIIGISYSSLSDIRSWWPPLCSNMLPHGAWTKPNIKIQGSGFIIIVPFINHGDIIDDYLRSKHDEKLSKVFFHKEITQNSLSNKMIIDGTLQIIRQSMQ